MNISRTEFDFRSVFTVSFRYDTPVQKGTIGLTPKRAFCHILRWFYFIPLYSYSPAQFHHFHLLPPISTARSFKDKLTVYCHCEIATFLLGQKLITRLTIRKYKKFWNNLVIIFSLEIKPSNRKNIG